MLLNGEMLPITGEVGLVAAESTEVLAWWLEHEKRARPNAVASSVKSVQGGVRAAVRTLLPLTSVERRRVLFLPTQSRWTAFFDSGWRGTDAAVMSLAARELQTDALRVVCEPRARMFELYGAQRTNFLNYVRTISLCKDGAKWRFDQSGALLPGEDPGWYTARLIRERFLEDQLARLLATFGARPLDEDFYSGPGFLVERQGPAVGDTYTLEAARTASRN